MKSVKARERLRVKRTPRSRWGGSHPSRVTKLDFAVHPVLKVNAKRRVIKVIRVQKHKPSLVTMSW